MTSRWHPAWLLLLLWATPAPAQDAGLVTRASAHSAAATVTRFEAAVRAAGWVVFTSIDHAAAAGAVGLDLPSRTVIFFGNPTAGTPAMRSNPTLALDLPMRVLVWNDAQGVSQLTRSSGADLATRLYARHGVALPAAAVAGMETFLDSLARQAVE